MIDTDTLTTWQLANLADCGSPDRPDRYGMSGEPEGGFSPSAGAQFLRSVATGYGEARDWHLSEGYDLADWCEDAQGGTRERLDEVADGAPSVYTHALWAEFVDLAAYTEDPSEYGPHDDEDMSRAAAICLYMIAERLLAALIEEDHETIEDDDEEGDEA